MEIERAKALGLILEYHSSRGWVMFMPHTGVCDFCHLDIVGEIIERYKAYPNDPEWITGCPLCNMSYCD